MVLDRRSGPWSYLIDYGHQQLRRNRAHLRRAIGAHFSILEVSLDRADEDAGLKRNVSLPKNVLLHKPDNADKKAVKERKELWPLAKLTQEKMLKNSLTATFIVPQVLASPRLADSNNEGGPRREYKTPAHFND